MAISINGNRSKKHGHEGACTIVKDKEQKGRTENHAHTANLGAEKMLLALIAKRNRAFRNRF